MAYTQHTSLNWEFKYTGHIQIYLGMWIQLFCLLLWVWIWPVYRGEYIRILSLSIIQLIEFKAEPTRLFEADIYNSKTTTEGSRLLLWAQDCHYRDKIATMGQDCHDGVSVKTVTMRSWLPLWGQDCHDGVSVKTVTMRSWLPLWVKIATMGSRLPLCRHDCHIGVTVDNVGTTVELRGHNYHWGVTTATEGSQLTLRGHNCHRGVTTDTEGS